MDNLRGKRAYPADFWRRVRWAYRHNAFSDVRLARDLGIDRKYLRERREKEGWEREGTRPADGERIALYFLQVEAALCFKTGEFADWAALERASHNHGGVADFLRPRAEKHKDWPNVRG